MADEKSRRSATRAILAAKKRLGLRWSDIAKSLGKSTEWTTSALLGQQSLTRSQAVTVCNGLGINAEYYDMLTLPPERGAAAVDTTDPLIYRLTEVVQVYGATISELVREEFGDGIMSAIDFELGVKRVADPKGDRVQITLDGKFLPYRVW